MPSEEKDRCQQCNDADKHLLRCIACKKYWCKACLGCMKEYGCMVYEWRCPDCNGKVAIPIPLGQILKDVEAAVERHQEVREARTSSKAYEALTGRRRRK